MFQPKFFEDICEDFIIANFKDIFLKSADDEHYQSTGLNYKFKEGLHLPPQMIRNIVEISNKKNNPILMKYLLPCMIESNKSNFQDIILRENGKYKIDKFIDKIMNDKKPSFISITSAYYSSLFETFNHDIITRIPNISANVTKLELDILFDSNYHVYSSTSSPCRFCNRSNKFTWNCPNLKQLFLSFKSNFDPVMKHFCGVYFDLSFYFNISFSHENLQELSLSAFALTSFFLEQLKTCKNLEKLVLTNMIGGIFEEVIEAMCCLTQLKYLNFSNNECVKEYKAGMNEQMIKLLNCLPHLDHVDVSLTALTKRNDEFDTWKEMRKFSYLGIASEDDDDYDDEEEEDDEETHNNNIVFSITKYIAVLEHSEVKSCLIPLYLSELANYLSDWLYEDHIKYFPCITEIIFKLINHRQIGFEEYELYIKLFGVMVLYNLSDTHVQIFLNAFFCEDLPDTLLHIRSFLYLYCLTTHFSDFNKVMELIWRDNRWFKTAFEVTTHDERVIPFAVWICGRYFVSTSQPLPYLDKFLKSILSIRHRQGEPFARRLEGFIEFLCETDESYCDLIESYESSINSIIDQTVSCSSNPTIPSASFRKRLGDLFNDPSLLPTATKRQCHSDVYISTLWEEVFNKISTLNLKNWYF